MTAANTFMSYTPRPISTDDVKLPPDLLDLSHRLAENAHDLWARQRLAQGWTFGPARDDKNKRHPGLVPFEALSESEKRYDYETAMGTLKAIIALGYDIEKARR